MSTGREFYEACCTFRGQPYSTALGRTDPNSGHKDCSGMVAAGFELCQGYELGAYVSTTIFAQSYNAGLEIPYEAAIEVVGAVIFRPENPMLGWGNAGHIAVSDGEGGTVEATPPRVQRLPLEYNAPWSSRAALLIDLDYSNFGEGTPEIAPEENPKKEVEMKPFLIVGVGEHDGMWVYNPMTHTAKPFESPKTLALWQDIFLVTYGEPAQIKQGPEYVALLEDAIR